MRYLKIKIIILVVLSIRFLVEQPYYFSHQLHSSRRVRGENFRQVIVVGEGIELLLNIYLEYPHKSEWRIKYQGVDVGWITVTLDEERNEVFINNIHINRDFRSQGIGSRVISSLFRYFKEHCYPNLQLIGADTFNPALLELFFNFAENREIEVEGKVYAYEELDALFRNIAKGGSFALTLRNNGCEFNIEGSYGIFFPYSIENITTLEGVRHFSEDFHIIRNSEPKTWLLYYKDRFIGEIVSFSLVNVRARVDF
ncbi:MAG: GNAT family N-acetyltransferase [Candidatus Omnitrophica bacterium]|nr:GNAT family N-acetyltransferase [Candidatus Omnitrophota bacterium]